MLIHKGTQALHTKRLILRRFNEADYKAMFYNWANDDKVSAFVYWKTHKNIDKTKKLVLEWVENYSALDYYNWVVTLDDEPIGNISISNINEQEKSCFIGYCLGQRFWKKGYAKEFVTAVCDFLIKEIGFDTIFAKADSENASSIRLLLSCGFIKEENYDEHYLRNDKTIGRVKGYFKIKTNN